jgi:nitrite reductase (NADH) small subunit
MGDVMMETKTAWVDICALDEVPRQGSRIVKTSNGCLALFKTATDDVYALDDKCPHKQGPLSQGIVHGDFVTCPLHSWVFSLATGEAQGADVGLVATTPTRIVDGRVELCLSVEAS